METIATLLTEAGAQVELLRDWNRLEPGLPGQNLGNAQFSSTLTDDRLTAGLSTWSELLDEVIARHIYVLILSTSGHSEELMRINKQRHIFVTTVEFDTVSVPHSVQSRQISDKELQGSTPSTCVERGSMNQSTF